MSGLTRRTLAVCALAAVTLGNPLLLHAQDKPCAAVLLHGKWGNPQPMVFFGRKLEPYCVFKSVEMPWSQRRNYDATYPAALDDVGAQVRTFREQGYKRVVLIGQSFGANAAMAYMADRGDVDAVVAMSPGHTPALWYERSLTKSAVDQARDLVSQGKPGETLTLEDVNQGQRRNFRMQADVLLSFFDPKGLGDIPRSVETFKKPVPFMWVMGSADGTFRITGEAVYNKAPAHPRSQYLVMEADHMSLQDVAAPKVLEWIKALD